MALRVSRLFAFAIFLVLGCSKDEAPSGGPACTQTPLNTPALSVTNATSCTAADGQVAITPAGGVAPYTYSFNNSAFSANPVFTGFSAGLYPGTVQDSRGCTKNFEVTILAIGSTLIATATTVADSECFPPHTGSIEMMPSGGTPPYQIKFGDGSFGTATVFNALASGDYQVIVKDDVGCTVTETVTVGHGDTGVSFTSDIMPIIAANCAIPNCHGAGAPQPNFTSYPAIAPRAASIKLRTMNGSMPPATQPDLTSEQIQLIACWVDDGAKNN